jgi:hypothetical protein
VKWVVLALVIACLLVGAEAKVGCRVNEFYGIAYTLHNPTERHAKMLSWLEQNKQYCKSTDYVVLWNSLSELAGSADSTELRSAVTRGYEEAIDREKK